MPFTQVGAGLADLVYVCKRSVIGDPGLATGGRGRLTAYHVPKRPSIGTINWYRWYRWPVHSQPLQGIDTVSLRTQRAPHANTPHEYRDPRY